MSDIHKQQIKRFGWKPDLPDPRDKTYKIVNPQLQVQSVRVSDKYKLPERVFDQGNLGSCTANAGAWILEFLSLNGLIDHPTRIEMPFSRLFLYWFTRYLEGTTREDSGAYIRDVIKAASKFGVGSEKSWPYNISKFATKPSYSSQKTAMNYQALEYQRVDSTSKIAVCDALTQGYPIQVGFSVFPSFMSQEVEETGVVPMPDLSKEYVLGGHSTVIVGYNAPTDRYELINSWGLNWGKGGYFTMPAMYLNDDNYADDFWIIKKIE